MKTYGVIMAGGGGTRFWPLSRQKEPKQLLNLSGKGPMINETVERVGMICEPADIYVVTNVEQADKVAEVTGNLLSPGHILAEPCARNTAACIGFAAEKIVSEYGDGLMAIFPSDHFIRNWNAFAEAIEVAKREAEESDCLLTLGIKPDYPSTGYGYIRYEGAEINKAYPVRSFVEKPDQKTAEQYVQDGGYAWNAGMFVWKASVILEHFALYLPEVYACLREIRDAFGTERESSVITEVYPRIPSVSIDYGILEKCSDVRVVPADMGWNDVGSWDNLGVLHEADEEGNIFVGKHAAIDAEGCITYGTGRLISLLGVRDLIVVETDDAVLVCDKERAQEVKKLTELLESQEEIGYL